MFYFKIVNGGIGVLSFMNHPPQILRSSETTGKKLRSPLIRSRSFETSISEIENFRFIVVHYDFPTSETEGKRETWRPEVDDGQRKRVANGFP